jgi:hypothetical protein
MKKTYNQTSRDAFPFFKENDENTEGIENKKTKKGELLLKTTFLEIKKAKLKREGGKIMGVEKVKLKKTD